MGQPFIRMYVDENGNYNLREDLSNDSNRFLCLTGVVMRIETHKILEQKFNQLKLKYFESAAIVLHRREIISARPPFSALSDDLVRQEFNRDLLDIIETLRFGVLSVVIDKKALVDWFGIIEHKILML